MKSQWEIEMDFENAKIQSLRLECIADDIERNVLRSLDRTDGQINANWKGTNAQLYRSKQLLLRDKATRTVQELRLIAQEIRRIAHNIYNTEMAALAIVKDH